ncbi:zinc finger, C3HC4 type (RING finger) protein [Medicago truncatula]|uniref:RING-type E3 ubiquitin transferase n=1 Tax=Medicago truncatula TaxID=3880 RepID=G7KVE5_MEDTR|nr:zinc finger, C3HC4 type (RING finger) protein [Medicago truncatula]
MKQIPLIPCDILCNCDEISLDKDANILYMTIYPDILKQILPDIGKHAKEIVANNDEDDDAVKAVLVLDDLKKVGMDHSSCYSRDQCSICLEELFNGPESECVMTKCLHVFHEECIFQWLKRFSSHQSSLLCPLCRNNVIF